MKTITCQISDDDYDHLVSHIARQLPGKPLVAVVGLIQDAQPAPVHDDISDLHDEMIGEPAMTRHPSLTLDRIIAAVEDAQTSLSNPGFCLACGEDAEGVEPDAENYLCDFCEEAQVFGAEQLLIMFV